jgi:PAS domain S-box-containing protein
MRTTFKLSLIMFMMLCGFLSFLVIYEFYRRDDMKLLHKSILANDDRLFRHILQLNRDKIGNPLRDYATWDDMLKYTANPGDWFEQQSFDNTLKTFSLDHLWVFNRDGKQVFSVRDTLHPDLVFPLSDSDMKRLLTSDSPFLHTFFFSNGQVHELFGSTITTSADIKHSLKPGGYIFFGHVWDKELIAELAATSGLEVLMLTGDAMKDTAGIPDKLWYPLTGPSGEQVAMLEAGHMAFVDETWSKNYFYNLLILFAVGLLGNAAIGLLLRYWIARPLNKINTALNSESEEPIRILKGKKNEFGQIADLISNTLSLKDELKKQSDSRELLLKRFTLAARSAYFGMFEWDIETNKFTADEFVHELFEVQPTATYQAYTDMLKKVHPEDLDRLRQEFARAAKGFGEIQTEYRLLFEDGRQKTFQINGILIRGGSGEVNTLTGICRDVTLEKQSMELIRSSEEKFRLLSENSEDVIWTMGLDGQFIYISPSILKLRGYTPDEIRKQGFDEMFTPSSLEKVNMKFMEILNTLQSGKQVGHINLVLEHTHRNAPPRWVEISLKDVYDSDGNFRFILGVTRNIQDRMMIQENLRISETRFRQIAESSSDFIWEVDANGLYTYCSDRIFDILGFTADEVVGKKHFYDLFDESTREKLRQAAMAGFARKEAIRQFVNEGIHKDGHLVILETNGVPVLAPDGSLVGYRGTDRDITVRINVERELRISKEKAEISSRLKSSLLNNMSHELRTPLNGILGFASLLRDRLSGEDKGMIEIIQYSGKRLMTTLNSIMELAEIEADQTEIHPDLVDLGAIVGKYLKKNLQLFEKKDLTIIQTLDEGVYARIDARLFESILFHLLDNAVKYTEAGSVAVEVKNEKSHEGDFAVFKVRDTGIGISEQQMNFIFDAFRQGDEGLSRSHEGAGLGLTLCRSFTTLMGGRIHVDSTVGAGSTFTLRFPLVMAGKPEASVDVPESADEENEILPAFDHKPRVLIVEDNEANSELLAIYLKDLCISDQVYSGSHAVKMAYLNDYQLILMDINLGQGLDGITAMKEIRKIGRYAKVPVVAVTGYTTEGEKRKIMSHGFDHFLAKPFERAVLLEVAGRLLRLA